MKTEIGNYYIVFNRVEMVEKYQKYYKLGYSNINGMQDIPHTLDGDFPIVVNFDKNEKSILYGIINRYKDFYFSDPIFLELYTNELRKKKLNNLMNDSNL